MKEGSLADFPGGRPPSKLFLREDAVMLSSSLHMHRGRLPTNLWRLVGEQLEDRLVLAGATGENVLQLFSTSSALFVENQGQWADESVRYAFHGAGADIASPKLDWISCLLNARPSSKRETGWPARATRTLCRTIRSRSRTSTSRGTHSSRSDSMGLIPWLPLV